MGKTGCVMACALIGILPTLACNAANNRWGVVSMGWRERRGGRHEVGMGASSWDARLEHGGTIWQGTSSIFSRIFTAVLSPLLSTKNMSMPGWGSWISEVACHSNQSLAWQCQRLHLVRTHGSCVDACRLVTNLSCFCKVYNCHVMWLILKMPIFTHCLNAYAPRASLPDDTFDILNHILYCITYTFPISLTVIGCIMNAQY